MKVVRRSRLSLSVAGALYLAAGSQVSAQTSLPAAADPVKAAERFQNNPFAASTIDPLESRSAPAASAVETGNFILGAVSLRGMTIYKQEDFTAIIKPMIGQRISRREIQQLTSAIHERYRQDGYALAVSYPPPQRLEDGATLIIQIDEGRIGEISFQTAPEDEASLRLLRQHLEAIRTEVPLTSKTLERHLLLINDLPGHTARAVLRPSASEAGATDLLVYLAHKPYDAQFATDNRGSKYLGPWQHAASITSNALFGMDERLSARSITTSPSDELRYLDVGYLQPLNTEGTKLMTMLSIASTHPGESLKAQNIQSQSTLAQFRAIHPYLRSRTRNLYARTSIDIRNTTTDIGSANLTDDRLRSLRVGASYDRSSNQSATIIDMEISQGLTGLGSTPNGTGRSNRFGDHGYTKLGMDISHSHALGADSSFLLAGSGQFSFNPLLSSEQFVLGGPVYGGAYEPGELTGDHGAAFRAELRYGQPLSDPLMRSYQLYSYYDVGTVWRRKLSGIQQPRESLSSLGFGVRSELGKFTSVNLELAIPLTRDPGSDRDNQGRIYGGLTFRH